MIKRIRLIILAALFVLGGGWFLSQTAYAATTVIVNGSGDLSDMNPGDGVCDVLIVGGSQCSLRAAIEELNAQGPDANPHHIEFDIQAGSGPITISIGSALPNITVPVVIDGETQPGASCPTANSPANLLIVLDGSAAGANTSGLKLSTGSDGSTIRGLAIGNFDESAISIASDNNAVRCNHIGVAPDGVTPIANGSYSISISGDNNTIGGQAAHARRNVISGNGGGFNIFGANNVIKNNYIGTTADGLSPLGNSGTGISLTGTATNTSIGGSDPLARNVIGDHYGAGIVTKGVGNFIFGNYIGVGRDGATPLPNGIGISVESSGNIIGSIAPGEPNLIAFNTYYGIRVAANPDPMDNAIRGNSIFENSGLGIDLGGDGIDTNDAGDFDTGPNGYQNYPVLNGISPTTLLLTGTLNSAANTAFYIDIYRNDSCDPDGHGEGKELVYWNFYQTAANGALDFSADTSFWNIAPGDYLTALATDPNGNTSEFSACIIVPTPPTPTPTPTNTPTATPTNTPTATPTSTPSPTPTATPSPTTPPPNDPQEQSFIPAVFQ